MLRKRYILTDPGLHQPWHVVDEHGSALARAVCPDGEHQRQSRETERLFTRLVLDGGVRGRTQARGIFSHVVPQDVLTDERCGIIPDAVFALPQTFPRAATTAAARRAALRDYLIEIKNIHRSTTVSCSMHIHAQ